MPQADDEIAWPSTTTFARGIVRSALLQVETCYPAIVERYRPPSDGRPAQVEVRLARKYRKPLDNAEDLDATRGEVLEESKDDAGSVKYEAIGDYPAIGWVPVEWPGLAGMHLTGAVAVGEVGMLCNTGRSIDQWQTRGGVVDPVFSQQFNLANAVWRPGLRSGADAVTVPASGWRLGADDGSWAIEVRSSDKRIVITTPGPVEVGGEGPNPKAARVGDAIALDGATLAAINAIATAAGVATLPAATGSITGGSSKVGVA